MSAQCMALVRDNCLLPTKDAPELGYVRESTDKQYVPDVFYKVSQNLFFSLFFLYYLLYFSFIYILSEASFSRERTSCFYGHLITEVSVSNL